MSASRTALPFQRVDIRQSIWSARLQTCCCSILICITNTTRDFFLIKFNRHIPLGSLATSVVDYARLRSIGVLGLLLFALLAGTALVRPAIAGDKSVVVVRQQKDRNSDRLIRGIKSEFKRSGETASLAVITISELQDHQRNLLDSLRALNPSALVPIGSHITEIISDSISDIPIVFAAVFQPKSSGLFKRDGKAVSNMTGASLDISPALQFKYFKQIYPGLRKLGLIYSEETAQLIPHAKVVAESSGIELLAVRVEKRSGRGSGREVKKALDSLLPIIDGLWSLADPSVFSPVATKLVIKRTLQKKIPFMGFSSTIVASGALFALDFEYKDIGRQVGELSRKVLNGTSPVSLQTTTPEIVWFHYNERTSKRIAIAIPEELQAVAKEVHK